MKNITLGKKSFEVQKPDSLASVFEFVIAWSTSDNSITNARLCAGAIGLYTDSLAILPKYRPMKETPTGYGYKCLERLLALKVQGSEVFEVGTSLLTDMAQNLPQSEEIEEKKDFFHSPNSGAGS